ncbi:MAG: pyruvate, phosphate dikinase [Alphaproteobacteria bacterium RIFCSPHIGHO2_12_FULL_63_12]|nr:MAG: pyruvate, phosphate dikinase [Alphaproteobacteria bacterium RIFCSPHIGHO2_12_FULL_63_12]
MTAAAPRWTLKLGRGPSPDRSLIGGKAASIARMLSLNLKVPPAFVVTTAACAAYQAGEFPAGLETEIDDGLAWLEAETGRRFGMGPSPLLLSVRSGAAISMPGMMDTVLNLGICDETERALTVETGQHSFARDTHRRFLELYASIVMKAPSLHLDPADMPETWRAAIAAAAGAAIPENPRDQLKEAVTAVFDSWNSRRARKYRQHNGIDDSLGTAVTIQAMVFGNLDDSSGTGVLFSRNPLTGERKPFGEYLSRAQGEDVVSGKFTPLRLDAMHDRVGEAHGLLLRASEILERDSRDMQDIEFTVQQGELYLLQARSAKRAPLAAVRAAIEMAQEGLISKDEAVARVSPDQFRELSRPRLPEAATAGMTPAAKGEGACPGVASGIAVGSADEAERRGAMGESVILVRETTSPEDVHGMIAARAIVTAHGGATSHAAVVSRSLGRPCVVGCGDGALALIGETLTVDGSGMVWRGALKLVTPSIDSDPLLGTLVTWARVLGDTKFDQPSGAPTLEATGSAT